MKNTAYNYAIIKNNYPELQTLSVLCPENKPKKSNALKKYAMIVKGCHKDGSESVYYIKYSNDIEQLHNDAKGFISWYNYPLGIYKSIQGYLHELS